MSQYIPQLAILLAMDWLIGMFRTITNIWGDACAVSVVDHFANKYAPDPFSRIHTIGSMVMMHAPYAL